MDAREKAALLDFVASVIWPGRTVRIVSTVGGEQDFTLLQSWNTTYDYPMAWVDGNRVSGVTWLSATEVQLPATVAYGKQVIIMVSPGAGAGYLPRNPGAATLLGNLDAGDNRITHLHASVDPSDAVRRDEVEAIATALVGANYVLKTGDTMAGVLKVVADADAASAVPRSLIVLRDGTQGLSAPLSCATAATDAAHLIRKGEVDALVGTIAGGTAPPNRLNEITTPGAGTWTVPTGVTKIWIEAVSPSGAGGGGTGPADSDWRRPGGEGGAGLRACIAVTVTPGQTVSYTVGGKGFKGGNGTTSGGGGGGGGGATTVSGPGWSCVVGGGAGGGGGVGSGGIPSGGTGGAGGTAGTASPNGGTGTGGAAGSGGTTQGGVGGTAGGIGGPGQPGGVGTASASPAALLSVYNEAWAFAQIANVSSGPDGGTGGVYLVPAGDGQDGSVRIRWFQV